MVRESVTWFGTTVSKNIAVIDSIPPSIPTNLMAMAVAYNQVNLSWSPSTDNVGVSGYRVYRDSALLASSVTTSYVDTSCAAATNYSYQVSAVDAANNESAKCGAVEALTPARPSPVLLFGLENRVLTLTWTSGTLQEADSLTSPGDWTDVKGATSPYQPDTIGPTKFYRLRY
jgi:hypothetical protein